MVERGKDKKNLRIVGNEVPAAGLFGDYWLLSEISNRLPPECKSGLNAVDCQPARSVLRLRLVFVGDEWVWLWLPSTNF